MIALLDARHFDLRISDPGLSDGNGLDVRAHARTNTASGAAPRGIVLSGFGMDEDVHRSKAAGFAAHLTKPINLAALEATIRQVLA